jgi:hypothetical protein
MYLGPVEPVWFSLTGQSDRFSVCADRFCRPCQPFLQRLFQSAQHLFRRQITLFASLFQLLLFTEFAALIYVASVTFSCRVSRFFALFQTVSGTVHFSDLSAVTFCRHVRFFWLYSLDQIWSPDHTPRNRLNLYGGGGVEPVPSDQFSRLFIGFPLFLPSLTNVQALAFQPFELPHSFQPVQLSKASSNMVCRRNPSVIEFSSDSDEIQEESLVPSPPPRRSLSKRGRGSGRMEGEGSLMPSQPARGRHQKVGANHPRRSTSSSGYAPCQ